MQTIIQLDVFHYSNQSLLTINPFMWTPPGVFVGLGFFNDFDTLHETTVLGWEGILQGEVGAFKSQALQVPHSGKRSLAPGRVWGCEGCTSQRAGKCPSPHGMGGEMEPPSAERGGGGSGYRQGSLECRGNHGSFWRFSYCTSNACLCVQYSYLLHVMEWGDKHKGHVFSLPHSAQCCAVFCFGVLHFSYL